MRFNTKTRRKRIRLRLRDSLRLRLTSDDKRNEDIRLSLVEAQRNRQTNNATIPFWCLCGGKPRAFTLLEMVVAIAILAMVIFFAGGIFKSGIESYRTAMAQAEIMGKLRVISQQLDSDFRGLRKDAPLFMWFQQDANNVDNRFDQIMFFADGDFQSTKLWQGNPLVGNVARIYYGQTQISPNKQPVLARRQHLFVAGIEQFPIDNAGLLFIDPILNDSYEHDTNSLSQWQAAVQNPLNTQEIIVKCFGSRPTIDFADASTLHNLMTEGVGSWSIQWSYFYTDILTGQTFLFWWPSIDPDGDPTTLFDSDFIFNALSAFGFYFNAAAPSFTNWFSYNGATGLYYPGSPANLLLDKPVYPQALKFTFTLYDSRGIFKQGQTFTHIVYLGE